MKNKKLRQAYDSCVPDQATKDRMAKNILQATKVTPMRRRVVKHATVVAAGICLTLTMSIGGYAAYSRMNGSDVASMLSEKKLAEEFKKSKEEIQIVEEKGYRIAYLGAVSGKDLNDYGDEAELKEDKSYFAVAVERLNGKPFKLGESFLVSPFIQGQDPYKFNIYTLGIGAGYCVKDGILYMMAESDNLEIFAGRKLYLGVMERKGFPKDAYLYNEKTGEISKNKEFEELNALFSVKLDPAKADEEKAKEYLKQFDEDGIKKDAKQETENKLTTNESEFIEKSNKQETVYKDGDLKITLPSYDNRCSHIIRNGFYVNVEGKDIQSIKYMINNEGTFVKLAELDEKTALNMTEEIDRPDDIGMICKKQCIIPRGEHKEKDCEYIGDQKKTYWAHQTGVTKEYTVKYDEQNKVGNIYALCFKKSESEEGPRDLGRETTIKEVEKTQVTMEIQYKDGTVTTKKIGFKLTEVGNKDSAINMVYAMYTIR